MWSSFKQLIVQIFGLLAVNVDSLHKLSMSGNHLAHSAELQAASVAEEINAELEVKQLDNRAKLNAKRAEKGLPAMSGSTLSEEAKAALAKFNK